MQFNQLKKNVSIAALAYVPSNSVIGIGSGTTVLHFIEEIYKSKKKIFGVVSSSYCTTIILKQYGFKVFDISTIYEPIIYIDSADEVDFNMNMIKGGGGALTKEKIIAAMSKKFVCIVDYSKLVNKLGNFPLPIEIIPIAYDYVFKEIIRMGGIPKYRQGVVTDNGNIILDVLNLNFKYPKKIELIINSIPGVVSVGLFSQKTADVILVSTYDGIKVIK